MGFYTLFVIMYGPKVMLQQTTHYTKMQLNLTKFLGNPIMNHTLLFQNHHQLMIQDLLDLVGIKYLTSHI